MELSSQFKDLLEKRNNLRQKREDVSKQKEENRLKKVRPYVEKVSNLILELKEYEKFAVENEIYTSAKLSNIDEYSKIKEDATIHAKLYESLVISMNYTMGEREKNDLILEIREDGSVQFPDSINDKITAESICDINGELHFATAALLGNAQQIKDALSKAIEMELQTQITNEETWLEDEIKAIKEEEPDLEL